MTEQNYALLIGILFDLNLVFVMPSLFMTNNTKLIIIKVAHTIVWLFFNVVIFYMLYAVLTNRFDGWLVAGYILLVLEGVILLICNFFCPLTILARRYSDSTRDNFDIYLPNWLAKYNKLIYMCIVMVIIGITIWKLAR